jgi:ferrous iron transport protein B
LGSRAALEVVRPKVVALVGNPNCGKTTLFNALTGSRYKIANYPGVTVEKKEGVLTLDDSSEITLYDLPGTYALQGSSADERIVTEVLAGKIQSSGKPDLVVAVVDGTNLERNLFLVSELIDADIPILLAINMMDSAERAGLKIYNELLAKTLDLSIVPIVAKTNRGLAELKIRIQESLLLPRVSRCKYEWLPSTSTLTEKLADGAPDPVAIAAMGSLRYEWIKGIVSRCTTSSKMPERSGYEALDRLLTSKLFGLPIMVCLFAFIFQAIFMWAQLPMELISFCVDTLSSWVSTTLPAGVLTSLLSEGIIPGVGNVIVFVPQIAILFLFLGILEDCGYLSRAAFLLDNFMRKVGLQGRSFIPLLSSFACAVPGILSTRSIPSRSDRLATIMIAPLMSCSARLPVYAVLIAAFIPNIFIAGFLSLKGLVLLTMYLLGIIAACAVAWILKKAFLWREQSFYVMEMPPLRLPVVRVVLRGVYDSIFSFLKNATTIILACSIVIWFLASYPKPAADFQGNPVQVSFAGKMGMLLEPVIKPLGFNWEIGFAIIASFPAREVFVTGLTTVYNVGDEGEDQQGIVSYLKEKNSGGSFSTLTALSLMVFYVFSCQCMSTLAVCKRETGSWVWTFGMFTYMTVLAYLASLAVYQIGGRFL